MNAPADNINQQGFTGHIRDTATGLTYMQARYYDPVVGRFLSNDPVGFAEGGVDYFNRYSYTANDPVNNIDPDGRACVPCITGSIGAFVGGVVNTGVYIATTPAEERTLAGGLANFGEGAAVGFATGSGQGLVTVLATGAVANATENAITDAASGNLDNFTGGAEGAQAVLNTLGEVTGDLAGGALEAAVGKAAGEVIETIGAGAKSLKGVFPGLDDFSSVGRTVVAPIADNTLGQSVVKGLDQARATEEIDER